MSDKYRKFYKPRRLREAMVKGRTRTFRRISTPYMTRIVPLDELLITTTGRVSLDAPAAQLQAGDQVLHDIEFVDKLEREGEIIERQQLVLEALLQDPTYVRANDLLHVKTEQGERSVFGEALIHDLVERGIIPQKEVYERTDYLAMAKEVKHIIDSGVREEKCCTRKLETIADGWLTGRTLFPSDWRIVEVLSEHLPSLRPFAQSYQRQNEMEQRSAATTDLQEVLQMDTPNPDWYNIYRFVNVIKGTTQRGAAAPKGQGTGPSSGNLRQGKTTLFPTNTYTEMVCRYLKPFASEKAFFSPILRAETIELPENAESEGRKQADPHFKKGFFKSSEGQTSGLKLPHMQVMDIYAQSMTLIGAIREAIQAYTRHMGANAWTTGMVARRVEEAHVGPVKSYSWRFEDFGPERLTTIDDAARLVEGRLQEGDVDDYLKLERGTLERAFRKYQEIDRFVPLGLKQAQELSTQLLRNTRRGFHAPRKELRNLEREYQDLLRKLEKRFGSVSTWPVLLENKLSSIQTRLQESDREIVIDTYLRETTKRDAVLSYRAQQKLLESLGFKDLIKVKDHSLYQRAGVLN